MKAKANVKFLGLETRDKKDGGQYTMVGFVQGIEARQFFADEKTLKAVGGGKFAPMQDCTITVDIVEGANGSTRVSLVDVAKKEEVKK